MTTKRTTQTMSGRKIMGAALLIAGGVVMLAYLGFLGFQVRAFFNASPADLLGSCFGFALASFRLAPYVAFNHGAVFSLAYKFLVLFSAFAAIVAGLVLLQNRAARTIAGDPLRAQEPGKGEQ